MQPAEVRAHYLRRLTRIAERLPNGLLARLTADAEFFEAWNQRKKSARASARISQQKTLEARAEERYWKTINR